MCILICIFLIETISLLYLGEEEKEEGKDAVEEEPQVEDTPQENEESFDEESEDEDESGMKHFCCFFELCL